MYWHASIIVGCKVLLKKEVKYQTMSFLVSLITCTRNLKEKYCFKLFLQNHLAILHVDYHAYFTNIFFFA